MASQGRAAEILAMPLQATGAMFVPAATPAAPAAREKYLLLAVLVLAALVRFWELGSFSLHKSDEDTTVLAAAHILEDGTPRFPSGMYYGRAIVQSYLIGASFMLFGESEWSARLPSALCGILAVLLGWLVARRFLEFPWRIAFALCLALLPVMIADSQEARMYGFMVTALLAATWQLFRWEEAFATRHLVAAVLWMLLAIQFQELALLGCAILMFPGLARGDLKRSLQGLAALLVVGVGYWFISGWQGSLYPGAATEQYLPGWQDRLGVAPEGASTPLILLLVPAVAGGALAIIATRHWSPVRWVVVLLSVAGLMLQAGWSYHLAALCWLAAGVLAWQQGAGTAKGLLLALLAVAAALAAFQLAMLVSDGHSLRKSIGMMLGWPSAWPFLQVARYSWAAAAVVAAGLAMALFALAQRRPIHEIWLYFALAVWAPLLVVGLHAWYVPPRYIEFALVPMLLTAFVIAAGALRRRAWAAAIPASVLAFNPVASWEAVSVGVRSADHRAAAQYLKDLPLRPDDIVIVEEVLMQKYYLGRVDYWLVSPQVAAQFVVVRDGRYVDQYTHSPLVDSVAALEDVLAGAGGRRVYIVGSAEAGSRVHNRGEELDDLLRSGRFEVVYRGPNGNSIWRADGH